MEILADDFFARQFCEPPHNPICKCARLSGQTFHLPESLRVISVFPCNFPQLRNEFGKSLSGSS